MPNYLIRRLLILGGLAIIGIIFIQSYWVIKNWDLKDKEFDQTVNIILGKVAKRISEFNKSELPKQDLIQRRSSNYYAVNINSVIDANVLEDYLYQEMQNHSLITDFEYALYDCLTDEMVYGNYCKLNDEEVHNPSVSLPKFDDLVYYFVVKFPSRESYLVSNMFTSVLFSVIAFLAILFFLYSIWVILRQKRLSELQKDFINNMTHEFKTPISSIKIAADVLGSDTSVKSNSRLSQYASIIKEQNTRLNDQVEKVLNIARLEKDSFELKKEVIELNEFVEKIVINEKMKLEKGSITLNMATESIFVNADRLHFTNVISSIIDNAIKYCKEVPEINVSSQKTGNEVLLTIADKGLGIEKEHQKKLFDKFYRVSTGDVHNVKGFGLGLFYVKNICNAHGWVVDLRSEIGIGTSVILRIPIDS